jgi:predicted metalloprotease with PDZ domain
MWPADLEDTCYVSLLTFRRGSDSPDASWLVAYVVPGGPAHIAGLRSGDAVDAIDGTSVTAICERKELLALMNKPSYLISIRRRELMLSLTVRARSYVDLIAAMRASGQMIEP